MGAAAVLACHASVTIGRHLGNSPINVNWIHDMSAVFMEFKDISESTPNEVWQVERIAGHHYAAAADFALEHLKGSGKCLIAGSPLFELYELDTRYEITYVDFREPPLNGFRFVRADACAIPLEDESFDALSSTCLLCHIGLGRYGDPERLAGDQVALKEFWRVLKSGAVAAVTLGPVAEINQSQQVGSAHRVYTFDDARRIVEHAGFTMEASAVWDTRGERWRRRDERINIDPALFPDYLSMALRKD